MTTFTDRLYALGTFSKRNKQTNKHIHKQTQTQEPNPTELLFMFDGGNAAYSQAFGLASG